MVGKAPRTVKHPQSKQQKEVHFLLIWVVGVRKNVVQVFKAQLNTPEHQISAMLTLIVLF